MAKKPSKTTASESKATEAESALESVNLARFFSTRAKFEKFELWVVGDSPLICHAWSEKSKREMFSKQVRAMKAAKELRDPKAEFLSSLYDMPDKGYGFPATAIKKCMLSVAHKDKGVPQTLVMRSLWIDAPYVAVRPALAGAKCNLPLVRIYGSEPYMREDMVRIGSGLRKIANFAYRATFDVWAIRVKGRFNASAISRDVIADLINESGLGCGIGDWRNEKSGSFGSFHLASEEEQEVWDAYALGKGKLPEPTYDLAA